MAAEGGEPEFFDITLAFDVRQPAAISSGSDRNNPGICSCGRGDPVVPNGPGGSFRYVR